MNKFASLTSGLLARKGTAEPAATTYAEELLKRVDATGPDFRTYGYSGSSAFGRRPTASESAKIDIAVSAIRLASRMYVSSVADFTNFRSWTRFVGSATSDWPRICLMRT